MDQVCIRFFVREGMRHAHQPIHEWLFAEARAAGIPGGTAYRASAGFGRHGLREDHFFELAGTLTECVEFIAEPQAATALVDHVGAAGLRLFFLVHPVHAGVTGL